MENTKKKKKTPNHIPVLNPFLTKTSQNDSNAVHIQLVKFYYSFMGILVVLFQKTALILFFSFRFKLLPPSGCVFIIYIEKLLLFLICLIRLLMRCFTLAYTGHLSPLTSQWYRLHSKSTDLPAIFPYLLNIMTRKCLY